MLPYAVCVLMGQVLHVAILVQDEAAVTALLDAGFSSFDRNFRRWTALDEAIATKHPGITKLLYTHAYAYKKLRMKEKKAQMLLTCNELPNYSVKVQTSSLAALLLIVTAAIVCIQCFACLHVGHCTDITHTLLSVA